MTNQLVLELFGAFQVTLQQKPVVAFESNKARALLAYLAVESAQAQARTTLAGLFWPDFREENARDNLRHTLANLRKLLSNPATEPPFLLIDRQTAQFNPQSRYYLDVAEFTRGGQRVAQPVDGQIARLERAVACYRGPFLQGFFLDDCSAFEEWLLLTRERFHTQMLSALTTLTGHFEETQAYDQAESYARRLIALDNLQEEAHCALMRILARRGQRSAALNQYEQCRQVLAAELGAPPSAQTVELHQQIQRGLWESGLPPMIRPIPLEPQRRPSAPPPTPNNLPVPTTSFVGRIQEVAAICAFLRQPELRLLTLHGTGGVGKTRLALQTARQLLVDFPDGCFWVELAPLQAVGQIPSAIAQSLGVKESAGLEPLQTLKNHLRNKTLLLVLDNYEHLLDAAPLVTELLNYAGELKCLVTSREPLHLQGEQEFSVPSLPLPAAHQLGLSADLAQYAAADLFIQRAQAVKPDFTVDSANIAAVSEICARLDGLPLAIELAAARSKFFAPPMLLQKLEASRLTFLRGTRDMPARHQTLYSAIAWSYELLSEAERKFFRRLAVFVGGCTVEATAQVCVLEVDGVIDTLGMLVSLVDKNLVRQEVKPDGEIRYWLLETIREFGLERLQECGEFSTIQNRFAVYYLHLVEQIEPTLKGDQQGYWLDQLEMVNPSLWAVLQWAIDQRQVEFGLRFASSLQQFWQKRGGHIDGYTGLKALLALSNSSEWKTIHVKAIYCLGTMTTRTNAFSEARSIFAHCVEVGETIGEQQWRGHAYAMQGLMACRQGDHDVGQYCFTQSQEIFQKLENAWGIAYALVSRGYHAFMEGSGSEENFALCEEALLLFKQAKDPAYCGLVFHYMGVMRYCQARLSEAQQLLQRGLELSRQVKYNSHLSGTLARLGLVLAEQGDVQAARMILNEATSLIKEHRHRFTVVEAFEGYMILAYQLKQPTRVLCLAGAAESVRQKIGFVTPLRLQRKLANLLQQIHQTIEEETATTAWATGAAMTLDEALAYALAEE